jgi:mono/diheme cytochrome c family protein
MKTKILFSCLILLVAIQFIPYGKTHVNPQVIAEPQWDSPETRALFMRTCGDCHSYETKWPWYSNVAPVSWLVTSDINEGRQNFNVSAWNHQERNKGNEAAYELREGKMPPWTYLSAHPEARLGELEKAALIKGLSLTFGQ